MNAVRVGDRVWSRVYGMAKVQRMYDFEHVVLEVPKDDPVVVHLSTLVKMGEA